MMCGIQGDMIVFASQYEDRDTLKALGATWNGKFSRWELPTNLMNIFKINAELGKKIEGVEDFLKRFETPDDFSPQMPKLKYPLYKFQEEALKKIIHQKRYGVWHEMGLGKSITSIALASYIYEQSGFCRMLVVCPLSVIYTWNKLIEEFCYHPYRIIRLVGTTAKRKELLKRTSEFTDRINFALINYDALRLLKKELLDMQWSIITCDESSRVKNRNAQCTKVATELADRCRGYVTCLTGTPISNDVGDIYSQSRIISPLTFGQSFWKFADRYCVFGGFEMRQIVGTRNKQELYDVLQMFSNTVKKKDVLELPELTYEVRELELTGEQQKAYINAKEEFDFLCQAIQKGEENLEQFQIKIRNALSRLTRCQQITAGHLKSKGNEVIHFPENVKLKETLEIIQDSRPQTVVVFSRFTEDLRLIYDEVLKMGLKVRIFDGATAFDRRNEILKEFDNGEVDVLLVQSKTGGYGLDLTKASICIFYSLWYSYETYFQNIARLHRANQKNNVLVINLLCKDTIDEDIYKIVSKKMKLSDYFFGEKIKNISLSEEENGE